MDSSIASTCVDHQHVAVRVVVVEQHRQHGRAAGPRAERRRRRRPAASAPSRRRAARPGRSPAACWSLVLDDQVVPVVDELAARAAPPRSRRPRASLSTSAVAVASRSRAAPPPDIPASASVPCRCRRRPRSGARRCPSVQAAYSQPSSTIGRGRGAGLSVDERRPGPRRSSGTPQQPGPVADAAPVAAVGAGQLQLRSVPPSIEAAEVDRAPVEVQLRAVGIEHRPAVRRPT